MTEKRFELLSYHFNDLQAAEIKDNLTNETLHLSIYGLVDLLNEVSQQDYDLRKLKEVFDEIIGDVE